MSKYDPLGKYLGGQDRDHIPMTFSEIEEIIGTKLPNSKQYPAWWSNNTFNNVMTSQWLNAGYHTESVNIASEKLVFSRMEDKLKHPTPHSGSSGNNVEVATSKSQQANHHPVFGCMKGTLTAGENVNLTEPADPEWATFIKRKYPRK